MRSYLILTVDKRAVKICTDKVKLTWLDAGSKFGTKSCFPPLRSYQEEAQPAVLM